MSNTFNDINAFAILGIEPIAFDLKEQELEEYYKKKMLEFHPDRFVDEKEKLKALQMTVDINDAYKRLKDPYSRGLHIIELMASNDNDSDNNKDKLNLSHTIDDPEMLTEIFSMQEEVDKETDNEKLLLLQAQNNGKADQLFAQIDECLNKKDLSSALKHLNALRYTQKISQQIGAKISK